MFNEVRNPSLENDQIQTKIPNLLFCIIPTHLYAFQVKDQIHLNDTKHQTLILKISQQRSVIFQETLILKILCL